MINKKNITSHLPTHQLTIRKNCVTPYQKIIIKKNTQKKNHKKITNIYLAGTNYKNSAEAKKQKKKKSLTGDY